MRWTNDYWKKVFLKDRAERFEEAPPMHQISMDFSQKAAFNADTFDDDSILSFEEIQVL